MSSATRLHVAVVGLLILVAAAAHSSFAQPPPATDIDSLRKEVASLREKVEKPPKDNWDKIKSVSGLATGIAVAIIGFWGTHIYTKREREAEELRKTETLNLERNRFEFQQQIDESKFNYERQRWHEEFDFQRETGKLKYEYEKQKWREELASHVTLKHIDTRLAEYSALWQRLERIARNQKSSGQLTQDVALELADQVRKWRYSTGGLLAEPTTRRAAYVFQKAVGDYDEKNPISYKRIREARRILRDELRRDMGISAEDYSGKTLIDIANERQKDQSKLTDLQTELNVESED